MSPGLRRSMMAGLGYGVAVSIVEIGFGTWNFTKNNLPAFTGGVLRATAIMLIFGTLAGVLAAPVWSFGKRSGLRHLLAMSAIWLACAWWVAVDRSVPVMWATPAAGAVVLVLLGRVAGRRWPALPAAAGVFVLASLCFVPTLVQSVRDPDFARRQRPVSQPVAADASLRPDVVVVVLDTVRAGSMSAYGYGLATTPVFDALAADSALFLDASAPATWSLPSHASLFTGLYPSVHGATEEHRVLTDAHPTLAGALSAAGYQTLAFTANPWISDHLGLTRGFDWSDEAWRNGGGGRAFLFSFRLLDKLGFGLQDKGGSEVARHFEDWVASRPERAQPAFAFLNFLEAHFPHHQLPHEYLRRFTTLSGDEQLEYSRRLFGTQFGPPMTAVSVAETRRPAREMYDAGVAYTDSLLGRVVEALRRRGTLDRTLLVVLADHGEMIGEHGEFGHGLSIFQPNVRVPLLVRLPGTVKPLRVETAVSTAGVFATVLDALSLDRAPAGVVPSLMPALEGIPAGIPVLVERFSGDMLGGRRHPLLNNKVRLRAYRSGPWKLVESSDGGWFLYDLSSDPDEDRDVAGTNPEQVARLRDELETWRAAMGIPELDAPAGVAGGGNETMDPVARERLKALGYLE